jgi:DNA repair/transcription protein MET18/MMS19
MKREPDTHTENSVTELKLLGPDFVFGVISMVDGERDPRNLLQLFSMFPHFIRTFPLGHLTEEMFEIMACYFPVDFYSVSIETS